MSNNPAARSLVIEREMVHPPEKIWGALTQSELVAEWLKNHFQWVVGHSFTFRATPMPHWNGVTDCKVLVVEPNRMLSYSWSSSGEEAVNGLKTVGHLDADTDADWHACAHGAGRFPVRGRELRPNGSDELILGTSPL